MVEHQYLEHHIIDHFHVNMKMRIFSEFNISDLQLKLLSKISLLVCRKIEVKIGQKIKRTIFLDFTLKFNSIILFII
jgi:hypothetical protein